MWRIGGVLVGDPLYAGMMLGSDYVGDPPYVGTLLEWMVDMRRAGPPPQNVTAIEKRPRSAARAGMG